MQNVGICNGTAWKPSSAPPPSPSKTKNSLKMSHFVEMLMAKCHCKGEEEASHSDLDYLGNAERTFWEWLVFALRWFLTGHLLRCVLLLSVYNEIYHSIAGLLPGE